MAFQPVVSESFYEFMVCMQNGLIRKVSVIYTKPKPEDIDSFEMDSENLPPLVIAKPMLSKCGSLNNEKQYQAVSLKSQTNFTMFKELGLFETRLFIDL